MIDAETRIRAAEGRPGFVRLLVEDVARSVAFYTALGFTETGRDATFVRMQWRPGAELFLVGVPPGLSAGTAARGSGVLLCFSCGETDVDTVLERARSAGARVEDARDMPWHTREGVVHDPDGYRVVMVQPA